MDININITVGLTNEAKDWIMSALSDKIAEVSAKVDNAASRFTGTVSDLKAQIVTLQATVDAGGATAADMAALQALEDKLDQIDPTTPTVVPTPSPSPAPTS